MTKKEPLYPHVPKSRQVAKTTVGSHPGNPDIYCYIPTKEFMVGMRCFYANSREDADEKAQTVEFYELEFSGTWDEIGERIKKKGQMNWLGEVGY